ncbi:MAG: hypothetical protein PHY54_12225 [Methylococcales bacterium]|nr:hypothetical protein [Methylococcales bacterium]
MNTLKEQLSTRVAEYDLWAQRRRYGPDGHNTGVCGCLLAWTNACR